MHHTHTDEPLAVDTLWKALVDAVGPHRLHPSQGRALATPVIAQGAVCVEERGPLLILGNAWGFVVEIRRWGHVPKHRRRFQFSAAVHVSLSEDIPPQLGRMEQTGSAASDDWSTRPQPHERAAFRRVVEHDAALTRALRDKGFARLQTDHSPPVIFRCADDDNPPLVAESHVESESSWVFESADPIQMARVVASLMEIRLSVSDPLAGTPATRKR